MSDAEKTKKCCCGQDHQGHLCVLHGKGMNTAIAHVTDKPTVLCFNCGRKANRAENVCNPMPLEEK
jgi:hypothetical protein